MLTALIIHPDAGDANALRTILEYLEYTPSVVLEPNRWSDIFVDPGDFDLVLLGPCDRDPSLVEQFHAIKKFASHVPHRGVSVIPKIPTSARRSTRQWTRAASRPSTCRRATPILQHALQQVVIYRETRHLTGGPRSLELFRNLVGSSTGIRHVRRLLEQVAATDATVLLLGESGHRKGSGGAPRSLPLTPAVQALRAGQLVAQSPQICWRASCLGTRRGHSPELSPHVAGASRWQPGELCFSTRSATCRCDAGQVAAGVAG